MLSSSLIKYAALPQILPRIRELFTTGFQYIPYCLVLVYATVRLLPAHHPYMNPSNIGRYGLRHVVGEAANNLIISWRNADQIILFLVVLIGLVMAFLQICLLGSLLFVHPVFAGGMPATFGELFGLGAAVDRSQDVAFIMLDMVFGVPGIFESCASTAVACLNAAGDPVVSSVPVSWGLEPGGPAGVPFPAGNYIMPIHLGMHQMFQLYSTGLLVVASFIAIYFMATIVAETMQSGTAFGRRYNKVWAPIRIVVAFGLLIPVGYGLNSSQYIVLYAAKYGSNFATNGWVVFNQTLDGGAYQSLLPGEDDQATNLVGTPKAPEISGLLHFMYVARTCREAYYRDDKVAANPNLEIRPFLVKNPAATTAKYRDLGEVFSPVFGLPVVTYDDIMTFVGGENLLKIRFGRKPPGTTAASPGDTKTSSWAGSIAPVCGELVLRLNDVRPEALQEEGMITLQKLYIYFVRMLWYADFDPDYDTAPIFVTENYPENHVCRVPAFGCPDVGQPGGPDGREGMPKQFITELVDMYNEDLKAALQDPTLVGLEDPWNLGTTEGAITSFQQSPRWNPDGALLEKGWAASAIWYNRVAELNGAIADGILNVPTPSRFPQVMENVYSEKLRSKGPPPFSTRFQPTLGGQAADLKGDKDLMFAEAFWQAYNHWQNSGLKETAHSSTSSNAIYTILNALLGSEGLFSMRENPDVHPLAQLSMVGKALVESSIRNLTNAVMGGGAGVLADLLGSKFTGDTIKHVSSFMVTFAMIGLTAGFILFYIVPFLPFIYFMFAFGGWIKGIFEAMVGAPLWALAHIRIDGNGLSGQAALSGYFLIFEIFLRPILMVFGLIASIAIFSALVSVLNILFDSVVANVSGFDVRAEETGQVTIDGVLTATVSNLNEARGVIDQFFFTVIYAIIVYLMGMSSFKLIDLIPNNILRWMGQNITTFNDSRENAAEQITGKATVGSQQATSAIGGGIQSFFKV